MAGYYNNAPTVYAPNSEQNCTEKLVETLFKKHQQERSARIQAEQEVQELRAEREGYREAFRKREQAFTLAREEDRKGFAKRLDWTRKKLRKEVDGWYDYAFHVRTKSDEATETELQTTL